MVGVTLGGLSRELHHERRIFPSLGAQHAHEGNAPSSAGIRGLAEIAEQLRGGTPVVGQVTLPGEWGSGRKGSVVEGRRERAEGAGRSVSGAGRGAGPPEQGEGETNLDIELTGAQLTSLLEFNHGLGPLPPLGVQVAERKGEPRLQGCIIRGFLEQLPEMECCGETFAGLFASPGLPSPPDPQTWLDVLGIALALPDAHRTARVTRSQPVAVRGEADADGNSPGRRLEGAEFLSGRAVPQLHLPVFPLARPPVLYLAGLWVNGDVHRSHIAPGAGDAGAVGAEADAVDLADVALEGENLLARHRIPHLHRRWCAGAGEALAVGTPAHAVNEAPLALKGKLLFAGARVPHPDLDPACGGEASAVGAEAHVLDGALEPLEGGFLPAGAGVPQLHRPVVAGAGQAGAVGTPAHAVDPAFEPLEGQLLPAGVGVPHPHFTGLTGGVPAGAGQTGAIGAPADAVHLAGVPLQGTGLLAAVRVPHLHRPVRAGGGEALAVRAEAHTADPAGVRVEGEGILASAGVPQPHRPVVAGTGQAGPVGAEAHAGVPLERA